MKWKDAYFLEEDLCLEETMTNPDSILKAETLLCQQTLFSQSYGFSSIHVWMWELDSKESWVPKKMMLLNCGVGEDSWESFGLQRPNQSILKEISPEYSLEWLMLKLKLQYFAYLMRRTDSLKWPWCWGRLKVGEERDDRGWDAWMASPTWWAWVWVSSRSWWWTGKPIVLQSLDCK